MEGWDQPLADQLRRHYEAQEWPVRTDGDGTLHAAGPGGVTWLGVTVTQDELASPELAPRLAELAGRRMPGGELCPLDLLAEGAAEEGLRELLDRLGLSGRPHVSLYSLAAA